MFEDSASSMPSIWAAMNSWFTPTVLFVLLNLVIGTIAITSSLASQKPHNNNTDEHQQRSSSSSSSSSSQLGRSPSVLQRLRSINFYSYRSQDPTTSFYKSPETETSYAHAHAHDHEFVRSPSLLQRLKSINLYSHVVSQPEPEPPRERTLEPETPPREEAERLDGDEDELDEHVESMEEVYSKLKGGGGHVGRSKSDATKETAPAAERRARRMRKSASAKAPAAARVEESVESVEARRPATVREARAPAEEEDEEVDARADDFINKFKQQLKLQRLDSILRGRT